MSKHINIVKSLFYGTVFNRLLLLRGHTYCIAQNHESFNTYTMKVFQSLPGRSMKYGLLTISLS